MQKKYNRRKSEAHVGYNRFHIGFVFTEYDLLKNYNSYTKSDIYTFWYYFDTILYQFLETRTSDRWLICIVQRLRFYTPFHFSFTVPLNSFLKVESSAYL